MSNLLAYIPVLNQPHVDWFRRHSSSHLFLISQKMAEGLVPRLSRNIVAVPTLMMVEMIKATHEVHRVAEFEPEWDDPCVSAPTWNQWVLPDEDISHAVAEKFLTPSGCSVAFEDIRARYDMKAVLANQPVVPDMEVSTSPLDAEFMEKAFAISLKSPDWWRQVAAVAVTPQGEILASACNTHMPTEYETCIFGDPAINRDAGQAGKSCALHAEEAVISLCAKKGLALEGAYLYVTTFPCEKCARQAAFAGVSRIFFREGYSSLNAQEVLRAYKVRIVQVK